MGGAWREELESGDRLVCLLLWSRTDNEGLTQGKAVKRKRKGKAKAPSRKVFIDSFIP